MNSTLLLVSPLALAACAGVAASSNAAAVPAVIQSLRIIHPSANLALVRIPSAHARRKYDAARQSTAFAVRRADLALWAAARGLLALRR